MLTQRVSVGLYTRLAERGAQLRSLFVLGYMLCSAALSSGENDLIKLQHLSKPSVVTKYVPNVFTLCFVKCFYNYSDLDRTT